MKKSLVISLLGMMILSLGLPVLTVQAAPAQELVILHPHSSDFFDWVVEGFEAWYTAEGHGTITVTASSKYSDACYDDVALWNGSAPEADVWWGGGEYYFEKARKGDLLEPYTVAEDANISASLGGWHLKDDSGAYSDPAWYAAAISGFGIIYNTEYLTAKGLAVPTTWDDLTNYSYYGHIVMCDPSESGSTTATVKQVLQAKCDQASETEINSSADATEGWQYWAKVVGNIGLFTTSSSQVPSEVNDGNYGIGICIDYYAYDKMASNTAIGFNYGGATTVSPDPAAIIKNPNNLADAKLFMDYLTSTEGQTRVGKYRTPANKKATATAPIPAAWDESGALTTDFPAIDPFNVALDGMIYSRARSLFTNWLVNNHDAATAAWKNIHETANATDSATALALYIKLPSNFNGTFDSLLGLDYHDTAVTDLWQNEGAANFAAAKAAAPVKAASGLEFLPFIVCIAGIAVISKRKRR
ncbi:MAG: ABC transporter substrate-binding protein [Candidatus Hodarchaeales archaeon]